MENMETKFLKTFLVVSLILFLPYPALSQEGVVSEEEREMVPLTPDFRFQEGIFLDFEQVKMNNPVPKAKILTSAGYNDRDFFKTVFENDKIYFYDAIGGRQEVDKNSIWGYSRNGILYIRVDDSFNRVTYAGALCHFVADITTYDNRYYNSPYNNYYSPYYSPYSYSYNPYYSPYGYGYPYSPRTTSRNELVQYILDFETGKMVKYERKNVELLLMADPELHHEFMTLSRKKKKQQLFLFVRRFNEKHQVYLPK